MDNNKTAKQNTRNIKVQLSLTKTAIEIEKHINVIRPYSRFQTLHASDLQLSAKLAVGKN